MNQYSIDRTEHWADIGDTERTPQERLHMAILARSLEDALGYSLETNKSMHHSIVHHGQRFFMEPSPSYWRICVTAGVDPRRLRKQAIAAIKIYNETGRRPSAIESGRRGRKKKAA